MVLDAFAEWCGPCKMISPVVEKYVCAIFHLETKSHGLTAAKRYSDTYSDVRFYQFDVDALPDLAQELGIRAMPTFTFFKGGEKADNVTGANPPAIEGMIKKLKSEA